MTMWATSIRHGRIKGLGSRFLNGKDRFLPLRRQGVLPHRRELKRVCLPKCLLIATSPLDLLRTSLASQASGILDCRDGVFCDGRCTEIVANAANTCDSALPYSCLESA